MRAKLERRLMAILSADVAGYSRLVAEDEEGTLARFSQVMRDFVRPAVQENAGQVVKTTGDGVLAAFGSAVGALKAALHIQASIAQAGLTPPLAFRIGIHVADIVVEADDILGDGVNVAARLQALADVGGICVSERVHEDARGRLEAAFDDLGPQQLKNIPRAVRAYKVMMATGSVLAREQQAAAQKPSIVVLPFENRTNDPEQEYFADAITEDLTTALCRWRWFFVIARNSAFAYKGRAVDVKRIGQELGVRYLLEGSVREVGSRVRITAQLIDTADATHIWAEKFDRDLVDILALQDEITELVVAAIEPAMLRREGVRVARKNVKDATALDCFYRGMWRLNEVSLDGYHEAIAAFREAVARDPSLALGHIGLSRILYGGAIYNWSSDPDRDLQEAYEAAATGIRLDPTDAYGHFALSGAALFLARHAESLDAAQRAVVLNPNFAFGYNRLGQVLIHVGRPAEAIAPLERCLRHSPFDPQLGLMLGALALAHYQARDYAQACVHARAAAQHGYHPAVALLGASLARMGRVEEARRAMTPDVLTVTASQASRFAPYLNPADRDHLLEGLAMTGLGARAPAEAS